MHLLVVNCNTSAAMTVEIGEVARNAARPGTVISAVQPIWGPASAEGFYESFITAAAVLDLLETYEGEVDGVVMAGFGEHGREGARQLLDVPVVDITEAAAQLACLLGHSFGVVTTVPSAVPVVESSLLLAGLERRCVGVLAAHLPVLAVTADLAATADAIAAAGAKLLSAGAEVLVLGCSGMAGLDRLVADRLGVPAIDGVAAAVALCESLVWLGKSTSKYGAYQSPSSDKPRPGWPPSSNMRGNPSEALSSETAP
jgi:allantoin racemase